MLRPRSSCSSTDAPKLAARLQRCVVMTPTTDVTISRQALAEHLLRVIARDLLQGQRSDLDSLCATIALRREDVRSTLSDLHREGYLDVLRMRLSFAGFALGISLLDQPVRAVRTRSRKSIAA
jgi:hypothetical protein